MCVIFFSTSQTMQFPALPPDEPARLQALRECAILDTPPEERFDRLTRLAQRLFGVKIALVSLIDSDRQWFKSRQGLDAMQTGRDISFCGHAILGEDIFYVPDATQDPRFFDNPLVSGPPNIRFYAGAPLRTPEGYRLGTLCVIDDRPRELTPQEFQALRDLADCVETELNLTGLLRQQGELRQAQLLGEVISHLQRRFLDEQDAGRIVDTLIEDLLALTESQFAVIADVLAGGVLAVRAVSRADEPVTDAVLEQCRRAVASGAAVFGENGDGVGEPLLAVPVFYAANMVAVIGLSERSGGYTQKLAEFLRPLLVAFGQWVQVRRIEVTRRESEARLHESEQRFRYMLETSPMAARIARAGGHQVAFFNSRYAKLLNLAPGEVAGVDPADYYVDRADYEAILRQLQQGEQIFDRLLQLKIPGAGIKWALASYLHMQYEGEPAVLGWFYDVTESKQAEKQLEYAYELLERSNEGARIGTWEVELDNMRLHWSKVTRELHEVPDDYDCTVEQAISYYPEGEGRDKLLQAFKAATEEGKPYDLELVIVTARGNERWVRTIGIPRFANGRCQSVYGTFQDISEHKRVDRLKSEFISTVSHELRTPLTAISGSLGLIAGGALGSVSEQVQQMIAMAYKNSQRLTYLINDLLDMEKLVAGKMHFDMQPHPLLSLLQHALEANRGYGAERHVALELAAMLPDVTLLVDNQRFMQIMSNLLSNAIKYSPPNGAVEVAAALHEREVRVSVRDRGPGVPAEFRERIFQKFSQADSSDTRKKGGTGLGLAITRELVERMGGRIDFESVEGQGAHFFFDLPVLSAA